MYDLEQPSSSQGLSFSHIQQDIREQGPVLGRDDL